MSDQQNSEPVKYKASGFSKFLDYYLEQLQMKKLVALFDKYEDARTEVILETVGREAVDLSIKDLEDLILRIEQIVDIPEYFDQIGKK